MASSKKAAAGAKVSPGVDLSLKPAVRNLQSINQSAPALQTETGGPNYQRQAADYIMKKLQASGATGTMAFGGYFAEEYLPEFKGRNGVLMADEMRRGDYQVQAVLSHIKNKLMAVKFDWAPVDAGDPESVKHAEFLRHAFFGAPIKPWTYNLSDMLSCLWAGFSLFEPTFMVDEGKKWKGKWVIKDFGWRNPKTIWQWYVVDNRLWSVRQISYGDDPRYVDMPGDELVCITMGREGNNYEGISLLRSAWGPYCRKQVAYVINMIGIERSLGVVVVDRPGDKIGTPVESKLKESLNNFTSGNAPWMIKPKDWPMKIEQISYNATAVQDGIRLEDANIAKSVQAEFIEVGMTSQGARAAIEPKIEHFDISLKHVVRLITDAWQKIGEKLIEANFGEQDDYPKFHGTGLDITMSVDLANSLKALSDSGGWVWDYRTRMWVREVWGAPEMSEKDHDKAVEEKKSHDIATANAVQDSQPSGPTGRPAANKAKGTQWTPAGDDEELHECACGKKHKLSEKRTELTEWEKKIDFAEMKRRFTSLSNEFNNVVRGDLTKTIAKYKIDLKNALTHAADKAGKYAAVNNAAMDEGYGRHEDDIFKFMSAALEYGRSTAYAEVKNKAQAFAGSEASPAIQGWVRATSQTIAKIQRMDLEKRAKFAALSKLQSDAGDDAVVFAAGEAAGEWLDDDRNIGGDITAQNAVNEGRFDMFQELKDELQGFQFSALMENSCPLCESLDKNTFKIDDPEDIELDPPLHPQCQCILVPILLDEEAPEAWTGRRGEGEDAVDQQDIEDYKSLMEVAFK